jgi:uncharacterized membrane protein
MCQSSGAPPGQRQAPKIGVPALFFFSGQGISCSLERPKSFPRLSSTLYFLAKSKMSVGRQCDGASAGYERCCLSQRGTEGLLATITTGAVRRKASFQARHAILGVFALLTLFVILTRDRTLLDSHSFLRQRYSAFAWLMVLHGLPGSLALMLGMFQFSNRLRQRYLGVHRMMGRIYVGCVLISAPTAVVVSFVLATPTLLMASAIQSVGWLATTGTGLYCARSGNIQQHREWMMRSYPFAMVFVITRALNAVPAIARMGLIGIETVVWTVIAWACLLPSLVIAWQSLATSRRRPKVRIAPSPVAPRT